MFCTKCGNQVPDGMKFCQACGAPVEGQQQVQQQAPQQPQQQGYIPSQPQQQQGYIPPQQMQQYGGYGQQPKKGGKGPIIAIIIVAVVLILGLVFFFFIWPAINKPADPAQSSSAASSAQQSQAGQSQAGQSQGGQLQTPSSVTPSQAGGQVQQQSGSPSISENSREQARELYEYALNDLDYKDDVTSDYTNTYGAEFGEFKSSTGKSGIAGGDLVDLDGDGQDELMIVLWKYNANAGTGYNQVYVYDMVNGKPQRISCGRSAEYGNTDHVAQVAYEKRADGAYIYLTTVYSVTTHEGGFCNPSIVAYKYTNGRAEQLVDTSAGLTAESSILAWLDSLDKASNYLPAIVDGWYAAINHNNYYDVCGWSASKKDSVPLFGALDKFDSDITVVCINYLMRSRQDPDTSGDGSGSRYYGYWEKLSGY